MGAFNPRRRVILIDASLQQDEHKFHFTLAHEIGHLALHRQVTVIYEATDESCVSKETVVEGDDEQGYAEESDWLEWQANAYGSALLMPAVIFTSALINMQKQMGIGRAGKIFIDSQPVNQVDYYNIIAQLSIYFRVSKTAAEYRLRKLGLVEDHRPMRSAKDILWSGFL
jgi:Zn-dependent peptidase ImmA (M78 family)